MRQSEFPWNSCDQINSRDGGDDDGSGDDDDNDDDRPSPKKILLGQCSILMCNERLFLSLLILAMS